MSRSKPLARLKQLQNQIVKMGGDELTPRFETLQLHAGTECCLGSKLMQRSY